MVSMLASSLVFPEKAAAAALDGTIEAFNQASMEDTRKTDKPELSDPDEQPATDTNLTANLKNTAFRASAEYEITTGDVGYAYEAFDGNEDTGWQSGEKAVFEEEWLEADLGGKKKLSNIEITFFAKLYGNVVVETSASNAEGADWTEVGRLDIPSAQDMHIKRIIDLTLDGERVEVERFVRLRFTSGNVNAANRSIAVKEVKVNGIGGKSVTFEGNLAAGKTAAASDVYGSYSAEYVTDGISDDTQRALRWQSGEGVTTFKNVWLQVDLKQDSVLESIKIKFDTKMYGNFIIQTSDTGENWEDLETVTDVPFTNDLHISYEKIFETKLLAKRYIRLYFTDVNTNAGNKSIAIREVELNGTQELTEEEAKPASAQEVLDQVAELKLDEKGTQIVFPGISEDYEISLKGSDLKQVISNDAIVTNYNFYDYDVNVLVQAVNKQDAADRAEKNMVLHVPNKKAKYPQLFPAVANPNAEPKIIPSVQEWYGYTGDFVLTENTKIVVSDHHNLGLRKAADNLQKDIEEFTGWKLTVTTDAATANDIELVSVAGDKYDTGKEGYILLNNDNGLKIYSSTYTGGFYGTMSVEQVFYQQRYDGQYAFPKGIMRDYPKFEVRGYMLDIARAPYRLERLYDYAKLMSFYKINEFHVHLNDNYHQEINQTGKVRRQ